MYTRDGRRRWESTGCKTKTDALKAVAEFEELSKPKPARTLLSDFIREFLPYATATYAPKTVALYRLTLEYFRLIVGDPLLESITMKHYDAFAVHRLKSVSPVTVNLELRAIKAAMNTASRWKLIEASPFARAKLLRVPESGGHRQCQGPPQGRERCAGQGHAGPAMHGA